MRLKFQPDQGCGECCDGYVSDQDGKWWAVEQVLDQDHIFVRRIVTEPYRSKARVGLGRGVELPWHLVGVCKYVYAQNYSVFPFKPVKNLFSLGMWVLMTRTQLSYTERMCAAS